MKSFLIVTANAKHFIHKCVNSIRWLKRKRWLDLLSLNISHWFTLRCLPEQKRKKTVENHQNQHQPKNNGMNAVLMCAIPLWSQPTQSFLVFFPNGKFSMIKSNRRGSFSISFNRATRIGNNALQFISAN